MFVTMRWAQAPAGIEPPGNLDPAVGSEPVVSLSERTC